MTRKYTSTVTVETDTAEHARSVLAERLGCDEDYGFDYSVHYTAPAHVSPRTLSRAVYVTAHRDSVHHHYRIRIDLRNSTLPESVRQRITTFVTVPLIGFASFRQAQDMANAIKAYAAMEV